MKSITRFLGSILASCWLLTPSQAIQTNANPQVDLSIARLRSFEFVGREGNFPTGEAAFSADIELCNYGYFHANVPTRPPMSPEHPFLASLAARVVGDRFEQISDYSFVYHVPPAFWSDNCSKGCPVSGGEIFWTACTATYNQLWTSQRLYLAPAEEIDPWLGTWRPVGSLFDGTPVDGLRDFSGDTSNAVAGRMRIRDSRLNDANPNPIIFQSHLVVSGELESLRYDNLFWYAVQREATSGTYDTTGYEGRGFGSILAAWYGSKLQSNTNGSEDGRVFVAQRTRQLGALTRYEYALHNRDNSGGISSFRIPLAAGSTVSNVRFRDLDGDSSNNWTWVLSSDEIVFSTPNNPLRWNSIYNIGFDSSASPAAASATLGQFSGAGAASFDVGTRAPLGPALPGCVLGEDSMEPNDGMAVAKEIEIGGYTDLTLQLDDPDWYRVQLPVGSTLRVEASSLNADIRLELVRITNSGLPQLLGSSDAPGLADEVFEYQNQANVPQTVRIGVEFVARPNTANCGSYDLTLSRDGFLEEPEVFCLGDGSAAPCPCGNESVSTAPLGRMGGCRHGPSAYGAELRVAPGSGAPSQSADELRLELRIAPPSSPALLLTAQNKLPQTGCFQCGIQAFDGLRCIGGDMRRLQIRATDAAGVATFGSPAISLISGGGFAAGQNALFTVFFGTDPAQSCFTGQNASNALRILVSP